MNDRTEEKLEELLRAAKRAPDLQDEDLSVPPPGLLTKVAARWSSADPRHDEAFFRWSWLERPSAIVLGLASMVLIALIAFAKDSPPAGDDGAGFEQLVLGSTDDDETVGFF